MVIEIVDLPMKNGDVPEFAADLPIRSGAFQQQTFRLQEAPEAIAMHVDPLAAWSPPTLGPNHQPQSSGPWPRDSR